MAEVEGAEDEVVAPAARRDAAAPLDDGVVDEIVEGFGEARDADAAAEGMLRGDAVPG